MRLHPGPLTPRAAQVLMATNRIDILDPALLRPGRIDRKIEFPNPNESSRLDILKIHSRRMNLMRGINLKKIADKMTGASGAELKVPLLGLAPLPADRTNAWRLVAVLQHRLGPVDLVSPWLTSCVRCRRAAQRQACLP